MKRDNMTITNTEQQDAEPTPRLKRFAGTPQIQGKVLRQNTIF